MQIDWLSGSVSSVVQWLNIDLDLDLLFVCGGFSEVSFVS